MHGSVEEIQSTINHHHRSTHQRYLPIYLGANYQWHRDDTETQLDELDIDILRLGNDSAEIAGKRAARRQRLFPSTSHPEEGRSQDTASVFENADRYQLNVGDSDHDHNSLVPDPQEPRHCNRRHPTREVRTSTPEDLELRRLSNRERSTNKAKKKISPSRWGKKTNQKRKLPIDELQIVPWSLNKPLNLSDDGQYLKAKTFFGAMLTDVKGKIKAQSC